MEVRIKESMPIRWVSDVLSNRQRWEAYRTKKGNIKIPFSGAHITITKKMLKYVEIKE